MIRLNIGCGPNCFPKPWENLDLVDMTSYLETLRTSGDISTWPEHQQRTAAAAARGELTCAVKDLRQGFPEYADGSVDAIYFGQAIEHLNVIQECVPFLNECWRMLRPGGKIRITTPDLDVLLMAYHEGRMMEFAEEQPEFYKTVPPGSQLAFLMFGAAGPNCTRESYEGHFHLFDQVSMRSMLEAIGFADVAFDAQPSRGNPGHRKSDIFAECVDFGLSHSMAVEAVKP